MPRPQSTPEPLIRFIQYSPQWSHLLQWVQHLLPYDRTLLTPGTGYLTAYRIYMSGLQNRVPTSRPRRKSSNLLLQA
ncbi:hypothetical protein BT67DRAFT_36282 [Trichocladium antarcticum]|uniref:Uncharacterized protein n=1 Tax=Trichocladium antarcticum TaxID=1450529 RepID=A0AAN6ULK3_9PEZI|nr:hypothetical protein BT67DRAFT_36282 [Trichocladium antarcticum]